MSNPSSDDSLEECIENAKSKAPLQGAESVQTLFAYKKL